MRLKGELFWDESVQKVLNSGKVLDLFCPYVKYGRTMHHPKSPGIHDDDRIISSLDVIKNSEIVILEKMDGENMTVYNNYSHARSINSGTHPSRSRARAEVALWQHDLPDYWRICGENMGAKHSIYYDDLEAFFLGFSMWDDKNICLNWDETLEWFELLGIKSVNELYRGKYDEDVVEKLGNRSWENHEGFVIRTVQSFPIQKFNLNVAKWVRKNHIQTTKHWMQGQQIIPNKIKASL